MLDRDKIIHFIKSYMPDATPDTVNKLAEELDEDITPYVCTFIRKIIELKKTKDLRR